MKKWKKQREPKHFLVDRKKSEKTDVELKGQQQLPQSWLDSTFRPKEQPLDKHQ